MTLVVGYLILKTFGMLALMSPLGGHNGICFSCKYIKLIHVINIWETVDCEIPNGKLNLVQVGLHVNVQE